MAMARLRDTVGVVNGLGRVAVAYSAEVSRELGEIASSVSNILISQFSQEERGGGHGLPDDLPGWENFTTGEFGLGAEYNNSPIPTPPNAYHHNSTHDASDSQTHEHIHHHTPQAPMTDMLNGGQRSFHTVASQGLFLSQMRAFHKLKARQSELSKRAVGVQHYMTSGDTMVGPTATNDKTEGSHVEQQQKVSKTGVTDECFHLPVFPLSLSS